MEAGLLALSQVQQLLKRMVGHDGMINLCLPHCHWEARVYTFKRDPL